VSEYYSKRSDILAVVSAPEFRFSIPDGRHRRSNALSSRSNQGRLLGTDDDASISRGHFEATRDDIFFQRRQPCNEAAKSIAAHVKSPGVSPLPVCRWLTVTSLLVRRSEQSPRFRRLYSDWLPPSPATCQTIFVYVRVDTDNTTFCRRGELRRRANVEIVSASTAYAVNNSQGRAYCQREEAGSV